MASILAGQGIGRKGLRRFLFAATDFGGFVEKQALITGYVAMASVLPS
jgi:hypothetical protein